MERHQVREGQVQPQLPVPLSAAVRGTLPQLQAGPRLAGRQRQLPGENLEHRVVKPLVLYVFSMHIWFIKVKESLSENNREGPELNPLLYMYLCMIGSEQA